MLNENGDGQAVGLTGPQWKVLRQAKCVESVVASWGTWNLTTSGEQLPQDVQSVDLTSNAGSFFGVSALLGRTLIPSDAPEGQDPQPVIVLSYSFWQRHFDGDPAVVGRTIQLVHKTYTIVGVLPSRFTWWDADVYIPLKVSSGATETYDPTIRLKPGVTQAAANAELQPLLEQFAKETPSHFPKKFRAHITGLNEAYVAHLGHSLFLLFGAVGLLLIIGCANVSILLLARGTARQQELAVRAAIGASRWRIQRQLLTEALALSLTGALGGILLAYRLLSVLVSWLPEYSFPHEVVISTNLPVLAFSVFTAIVTGALAGISPALQFSRPNVSQLMQSGSRRTTSGVRGKRAHAMLVMGQIALTLLLLTSAAAAINGFVRIVRANLGYDPQNVMSVGIPVHQNAHVSWEDRSNYFEQIRERVAALPEVVSAGISTNATPPWNGSDASFEIFGQPSDQHQRARLNYVDSEYFSVLHVPLLAGRLWEHPELMRGARLCVVNQTFARQFWPQDNPIGKQLRFPDLKGEPPYNQAVPESNNWMQVIAVAADARDDGLRNPVKPAVFIPFSVLMRVYTQILVRTNAAPLAALNSVRAAVKSVDPDQQVVRGARSLQQWIERMPEYSYGRLVSGTFGAFSILALALAATGLFSVVSYTVAQRTNEFGIRMALGANGVQVLQLVFASTLGSVLGGLAVGVILSLALSKVFAHWAEGSAQSPVLFIAATVLLILIAALAALVPARRAFSIDPMEALRYE
ncbi:MAG: ABC transporter permease [Acidobacteria bacterium]|nr:MAG: ABC transporter permease [Acidobacteriota bacterium]